jgi:hypothetical protein
MRKTLLIASLIGVGVIALVVSHLFGYEQTITLPKQVEEVIKVEVQDELSKRVEDAQKAAEGDIEANAKAAYEFARNKALKEIELKTITEYRKEVESREAALEKDLSL